MENQSDKALRIDFVSDVVCPWCIIAHGQLSKAMQETGIEATIKWHPFELNPNMPAEGQNLREHLSEKYGTSTAESERVRAQLTKLGQDYGFDFRFSDDSRLVNTFLAHQLIEWADELGYQSEVKLALFHAHFTDGLDVSDISVLVDLAAGLGLDGDAARAVLDSGKMAWNVRGMQKFWTDKGVQGVPALVFQGVHLVTGAQGVETYAALLRKLAPPPPEQGGAWSGYAAGRA